MSKTLRHFLQKRFACGTLFRKLLVMNKTVKENKNVIDKPVTQTAKLHGIPTVDQLKTKVKFEVLPSPVKSASDKKEYRVIRLENGLTACLISDPSPKNESDDDDREEEEEEDEGEEEEDNGIEEGGSSEDEGDEESSKSDQKLAACALSISVGSFSDPKSVPGMAHFLEHMVFMGSEKYPEENDFDSFITSRGGHTNASTDCEVTTFFFTSLDRDFFTALDKFSQFFISPLMHRGSIAREREAIESEFQMSMPVDVHRKEQLIASFAKEDAPINAFSWGNLITLRDNVSEDDLYEGVHKFRRRHYSAHRMTVAIQARLPLDLLQAYVLKCFGDVPCNNLPPDDFKVHKNVFDTPQFTKLYYVQPQSEQQQVELTWTLPSLLDKYKSKPHQYVSWLVGDEGKGSLISYLRKKVWVLSISTGNGESGFEHNTMYAVFTISMSLTDEGLRHLNEVIETVFSYVNMLRKLGPQERIFNEIKLIDDTSFKFATEETAADVVDDLAEAMHLYPSEDYIAGGELYYEYDPEGIQMVLNSLVPRKMNVIMLCNNLPPGLTFDETEPWFGTKYTKQEIPKDWLNSWEKAEPLKEFSIPSPNEYLAEDFTILPPDKNNPEYPTQILKTDIVDLWYRKDQKFNLPTAYIYLYLINPSALESPLKSAMTDFYINLLQIQLIEDIYPAQMAELSYAIKTNDKGIVVTFSGYNEKLHMLVELFTKHIKDFETYITEEKFLAVKDKLSKFYYNSLLKPDNMATDARLHLLINEYHSVLNKYNVTSVITVDELKQFSKDLINNLYIKALVQGNVTKHHVVDVIKALVEKLDCKPIDHVKYPKFRVFQIPKGETYCVVESFNKSDSNSIITNYYQSGPFTIKENVTIELITLILQEPIFDTLRTKEQLGYNVSCSTRDTHGILGFSITVNSQVTKCTTQHVNERIEEFIKQATQLLDKMSMQTFERTKEDLIKIKRISDVHLKEEVKRNWSEIVDDEYRFDRDKREIAAIEQLTLQDVQKWWTSHTDAKEKDSLFRKLSLQVSGFDSKKEKEQNKDKREEQLTYKFLENGNEHRDSSITFIKNIQEFKKDLYLHPAICRCE